MNLTKKKTRRKIIDVAARFWSKVKLAKGDACWEWQAFCYPSGHGQFHLNGKDMSAARALWIFEHGELQKDQYVCHTCDNPRCVRPDHLYLGNHQTNMTDVIVRKRRSGERHPFAKLNWVTARKIRSELGHRSVKEIAAAYGVSRQLITHISHNRCWKVERDPLAGPDIVAIPSLQRPRWERHPKAKLNWEKVRSIRSSFVQRTHKQLAADYGVAIGTIDGISRNLYWKVEDDPLGNLHN